MTDLKNILLLPAFGFWVSVIDHGSWDCDGYVPADVPGSQGTLGPCGQRDWTTNVCKFVSCCDGWKPGIRLEKTTISRNCIINNNMIRTKVFVVCFHAGRRHQADRDWCGRWRRDVRAERHRVDQSGRHQGGELRGAGVSWRRHHRQTLSRWDSDRFFIYFWPMFCRTIKFV